MKHVISVVVDNEAGVLSRVAGLFSARGFNIESLTVAPTGEGNISQMIIVTSGKDDIIEQIVKQLHKLVPVLKVNDLTDGPHVMGELMLVKVAPDSKDRAEVLRISDIFRCRVVDASPSAFIIEVTGGSDKLNALLAMLAPLGVVEVVRTGPVAMARTQKEYGQGQGSRTTPPEAKSRR
ncbi:MAG: acetolactate synthase small subunit [Magnetococcales bacterium]|nr:acetolactate synthase small subunit [Magnetococcales bacterium]